MKRYLSGALLLALLLWPSALSSQGQPGSAADPDSSRPDFRPGQVLVKFRPQTSPAAQEQLLAASDLPVLGQLLGSQVQLVGASPGQEQATLALLNQDPRVEFAELDYAVHASVTPNDPYLYLQWGLLKIQAPTAWDQSTGGPEVIIAV